MQLIDFKKQVEELFASNRLKEALALLNAELSVEAPPKKRTLFLQLRNRFNAIQEQKIAEVISWSEANVATNKIGMDFLQFVEQLEQSDLKSKTATTHQDILNSILVICPAAANKQELEEFFQQLRFINARVQSDADVQFPLEGYDLIIFDNQHLPDCPVPAAAEKLSPEQQSTLQERVALMQRILSETTTPLLHYGERLYLVNEHRQRIYAANSRFSLYARTKELLDFINTYLVK